MAKGSSSGTQRRAMPRSYTVSALEFIESDLGSFPRIDLAPVPDLKYRYGGSTQQWAINNLKDWRLAKYQWDWQSGMDFQDFKNETRIVPNSAVPSPPPETLVQVPRNESDVVAKMVTELLGPLLHLFKRAGWIPSKAKGIQMDKYEIHLECLSESSIPVVTDDRGPGSGSAANDSETGTSRTRDTTASTTNGKGKGKQIRFAVGTKTEQPELEPEAPKTGNLGLALRIDTIFVLSLLEQTPPPATAAEGSTQNDVVPAAATPAVHTTNRYLPRDAIWGPDTLDRVIPLLPLEWKRFGHIRLEDIMRFVDSQRILGGTDMSTKASEEGGLLSILQQGLRYGEAYGLDNVIMSDGEGAIVLHDINEVATLLRTSDTQPDEEGVMSRSESEEDCPRVAWAWVPRKEIRMLTNFLVWKRLEAVKANLAA